MTEQAGTRGVRARAEPGRHRVQDGRQIAHAVGHPEWNLQARARRRPAVFAWDGGGGALRVREVDPHLVLGVVGVVRRGDDEPRGGDLLERVRVVDRVVVVAVREHDYRERCAGGLDRGAFARDLGFDGPRQRRLAGNERAPVQRRGVHGLGLGRGARGRGRVPEMDVDSARFALSGTGDDDPLDAVTNRGPTGRNGGDGEQGGGKKRGAGGVGGLHCDLTLFPTFNRWANPSYSGVPLVCWVPTRTNRNTVAIGDRRATSAGPASRGMRRIAMARRPGTPESRNRQSFAWRMRAHSPARSSMPAVEPARTRFTSPRSGCACSGSTSPRPR